MDNRILPREFLSLATNRLILRKLVEDGALRVVFYSAI